ncbi:MAG: type IX secretion system outer membrane channel protein PorV [Tenuifilaceae bacterium]|jgi:hypothetical protein|nr:type IX secretion system outer membrane channel protein PorV [Tenuifilaceae bacterium]
MVKRFSIVLLTFLIFSSNLFSQSEEELEYVGGLNALKVAVSFLMIAPDSRASAMGDVGVASTPDANSQHWNPAKYAFIDKDWGVAYSYTPWLQNLIKDMDLNYLTGYYRFDDQQVVSASLLYFSMGTIIFTDDQGTRLLDHNANEFAIDLAYSRKFSDKIAGSIGFRYIRSDLTGGFAQQGQPVAKAGNSAAADISTYYQTPLVIDNKNSELAIGLNISNIGVKVSYNEDPFKQFIPINMRLGSRFSMDMDAFNTVSFMVDANKLLVPTPPIYSIEDPNEILFGRNPDVPVMTGMLQSFYDAPGGFQEELREVSLGFGLEYLYSGQFAIRGGYFNEHSTKGNRKYFTLGAGIKYNVFNLDFAYLVPTAGQSNPLANTFRFTLSFEFEPQRPGRRIP